MKYFLSTFFVFFTVAAFSQTNVSGTLVSDTEWTLSGSPYNLVGTLGVASGATLTIQVGVVINGNFDLLVKGAIRVNGSQAEPVNINNTRLIFKSANLDLSAIDHAQFSNAGVQLADEGEFSQDSPKNSNELVVSNSVFINSAYAKTKGYESTAGLRLEDCSFTNAIVFGFYPRSETIELVRATVESSSIESDSYNKGIHIMNSMVNNSSFKIGCCGANISVSDSEISNSTFVNGGGSPVTGPLNFRSVKFTNTSVNLPSARVSIEQCSFSATSLSTSFLVTIGNGTVKKSTFQGTSSISGLKITGYDGYNINGDVLVDNVEFETLNGALEISNFGSIKVLHSNFINTSSYNLVNTSNKNVDAKNNYWGTVDELVIQNKILDLYDDINYGEVNYSEYVVSPFIIDPLAAPVVFKGIHKDGTLLHWTKSSDSNVIGYKIYEKSASDFIQLTDVGDVDSFVVAEEIATDFVVTAYNELADGFNDQDEGNESAYSIIAAPFISIANDNSISVCEEDEFDVNFVLNYPFENNSALQLEASISEDFVNPIQIGAFGASPNFVWSLPDTISETGTIYYRLISNQFEIQSETKSINIKPKPEVDFSLQILDSNPGSYLVSVTGITSLMDVIWNTSGAVISEEQEYNSFVATWSTSGPKDLTLLVSLDGCETTIMNTQLVVLPPALKAPEICSIVFDETTGQNKLSWNSDPKASQIWVYRNTSAPNQFEVVAKLPTEVQEYIDPTSVPMQRSYIYRLTAIDLDGNQTDPGDEVKSIHLQISTNGAGSWNLNWEPRTELSEIEIYKNEGFDWEKIVALSSAQSSYTDNSLIQFPKYQIKIPHGADCQLASNITFYNITGLTEDTSLYLHPNPTQSEIRLFHSKEGVFDIIDHRGAIIMSGKIVAGENVIDLNQFAPGLYFLQIETNGERKISKFVKQR